MCGWPKPPGAVAAVILTFAGQPQTARSRSKLSCSSGFPRLILECKAAEGARRCLAGHRTRPVAAGYRGDQLRVRRHDTGAPSLRIFGLPKGSSRDWYVPGQNVLLWVFRPEL